MDGEVKWVKPPCARLSYCSHTLTQHEKQRKTQETCQTPRTAVRPKNNPGYVRLAKHKHYKTSHLITRSVKNVSRWKCGILGRVPRCIVWEMSACLLLKLIFPSRLAYLSVCLYFYYYDFSVHNLLCVKVSQEHRGFFFCRLYCFLPRSCRPTECPLQVWECVCTYTCAWILAFALKSAHLRRLSPRQQGAPLRRGDHQGVLC